MKAVSVFHLGGSPAPKEWLDIPEVKAARPHRKGFIETSFQILDGTKNIGMWMGAKNGVWYNASEPFLISKK